MFSTRRTWVRRGRPAGVSVLLTVIVGVLTNLATDKLNWALIAALLAMTITASVFEVWRARVDTSRAVAAQSLAEAAAHDAEDVAIEAKLEMMRALDEVINPVAELLDKVGNTRLPYGVRMQYRGVAKGQVLTRLGDIVKRDGRVRASYYAVDPRGRSLRIWSPSGRSTLPARFTEQDAAGRALFEVLDRGEVRLVDRGDGSYPELAKIATESPIVALAPVRAWDEAVGLLVVDAPSHSELTEENLYVVDLFAKLLALLVADDEFPEAGS